MCTGSGAESREGGGGGIINSDNWISKSDDDHQDGEEDQNFQISGVAESTMKARTSSGGAGGLHGIIRRLPLNAHLGKLPLHEVGEEVVSLGRIACPIILTTLLIHSRSIVSTLFLSHLGDIELAGGSLALGFYNITGVSIMKGLSVGMDPICGQAFGAKRWAVLSQTFQKMLCLLLFASTLLICLLWVNLEPIFLRFGQDPDIINFAKVYIMYCIPELIAQAILHPMRSFLRTQGLTTPPTIAAIIAAILHTPINYILVIKLNLGAKGVALALACSTMNMNIGLLLYMAVSPKPIKPWSGLTFISMFQGWWPLLSLALPSVISVCLEWWWYEIMLFLCGLLSNPKASVSATGILIQTTGLLYVFPFSLSSGLNIRVSHALGAGQPTRAQWTAIIGITLAFGYAVIACVFTTLLRSDWGKLYTSDPEVIEMISIGLPIVGLCELGNAPQTAACGVLTGTARPKEGARINLFAFYLVGFPVAILLTFQCNMGYRGLWLGLFSAQIACVSMMLYTILRTDWKHQAKRAEELTAAVGERDDLEDGLLPSNNDHQ
ncbi:Protein DETOXIFICATION 53 [Linum grandiflorum]